MYKVEVKSKYGTQKFYSEQCVTAMLLSCGCVSQETNPLMAARKMEAMERCGEIVTLLFKEEVHIASRDVCQHLDDSKPVSLKYVLTVGSYEELPGEKPRLIVRYMLEGPTLGTVFDLFYAEAAEDFLVEPHKLGALMDDLEASGQMVHSVTHGSRIMPEEEVLSMLMLEKETGGHA